MFRKTVRVLKRQGETCRDEKHAPSGHNFIQEYLHWRRLIIIKKILGQTADLDLGVGWHSKGSVTLDLKSQFSPQIVADIESLPPKE